MPKIEITHPTQPNDPKGFMPYKRDDKLVRPWGLPGTPGLEHRIGGLEKQDITGTVSYDPNNHEVMIRKRAEKIAGVKPAGPTYLWTGPKKGDVLLVGWGGTYGAIKAATGELRAMGVEASACHLRYLNPLPEDLGGLLKQFKRIIVVELNLGQLRTWLAANYLMPLLGLNKIKGQPFMVGEIVQGVRELLEGEMKTQAPAAAADEAEADAG